MVLCLTDVTEEQYNSLDTEPEFLEGMNLLDSGLELGLGFWYDDGLCIEGEDEHLVDVFAAMCYWALDPENEETAAMAMILMEHDDLIVPTH